MLDAITDGKLTPAQTKAWLTSVVRSELERIERQRMIMLTDEQTKLLNTLTESRTASAITAPIGTDVEFLEASRSGSVSYEQFLAYWDRQISICTTGETLTSQVGDSGSRALGEVHQEMLELLVDSDGDLLSDTLRERLLDWIVDYNLPGAAVPSVWRVHSKNEKAEAETRTAKAKAKAKAKAADATSKALRTIVQASAAFEDDQVARDYIVSFEVTDALSDSTIDAMVAGRRALGASSEPDDIQIDDQASFAAARLKKTLTHRHVCFAEPGGPVERITDLAVSTAGAHFTRRLRAVLQLILTSSTAEAATAGVVELAARWTPDALAALLDQALELAGLEGREAVFADAEPPRAGWHSPSRISPVRNSASRSTSCARSGACPPAPGPTPCSPTSTRSSLPSPRWSRRGGSKKSRWRCSGPHPHTTRCRAPGIPSMWAFWVQRPRPSRA